MTNTKVGQLSSYHIYVIFSPIFLSNTMVLNATVNQRHSCCMMLLYWEFMTSFILRKSKGVNYEISQGY